MAGVKEDAIAFADGCDPLALHHLLDVLGGDDPGIRCAVLFGDWQLAATQRDRVE